MFRFILPALQSVTTIHEHFFIKTLVPGGILPFSERPNHKEAIHRLKDVCSAAFLDSSALFKTVQDHLEDDADGAESASASEEAIAVAGDQDPALKNARGEKGVLNLSPAVKLEVPLNMIAPSVSSSFTRAFKNSGTFATKGVSGKRIHVASDFAQLAKGVHTVDHDCGHVSCKLEFECSAAHLVSRLAYREGFGTQFKRRLEGVDNEGSTHWVDHQILFGKEVSDITAR